MIPFLVGAGLSIYSSLRQNENIESTSSANYSMAVARAEREAMAQRGQLMAQSRENSIAVNQERYNLQREAMRERSAEAVAGAEGGFSGVLAKRIQTATSLAESQESSNIDVNQELEQDTLQAKAYGVEQGRVDRLENARLARHNALAERRQGVDLVVGAVSGGASAHSMAGGLGLGGADTTVNPVKEGS